MNKKFLALLFLCVPLWAADTTTTRAGLVKPEENSTGWGPKIRANYDIIDSSFALKSVTNDFTADQDFSGLLNIRNGSAIRLYPDSGGHFSQITNSFAQRDTIDMIAVDGVSLNSIAYLSTVTFQVYPGDDAYPSFALFNSSIAYSGFMATGPITQSTLWTLPKADGTTNQILITDGNAHLLFTSVITTATFFANARATLLSTPASKVGVHADVSDSSSANGATAGDFRCNGKTTNTNGPCMGVFGSAGGDVSSNQGIGVQGFSNSAASINYGIYGSATSTNTNRGGYFTATGGTFNFGIVSDAQVQVNSSMTVTGAVSLSSTVVSAATGLGWQPPQFSKATLATLTPSVAGLTVGCTDCTALLSCISSGTARGAWASPVAKATACN